MDLINRVMGGLGLGGQQAPPTAKYSPFKSYLSVEDGNATCNTAALVLALVGAVGAWTNLWERTIPAQQMWRWGYGSPATPQNQGYMWFAMLDSGTDWHIGILRLVQQNANRTRKLVVAEMPDSQLHSTTVTTLATAALIDKNQMIALPEKVEFPLVGEDSLIGLEYNLITSATVADNAGFRIPCTKYQ